MLARVSGGKSGIVEYLIDGIKNGRDFTRNELDERVCIDGNLDITDAFLKAVSNNDSDNYLHITLSFKEKDITTEQIKEAYEDYKDKLMSAYSKDEYNCYAEIHFPKIQKIKDERTGEMRDRYPHVHMVIPKTNMLTNKELNPVGLYSKIESYHDSIQESVNRKFDLSSPYDNPREMKSNADLISRYKGDNFKPANKQLKSDILDRLNDSDLKTWDVFKEMVSEYGEVKETNSKQHGKYLSVKLPDAKNYVRLKESCFSEMYVNKREYKNPKPSDKALKDSLDKWVNKVSHEVKHISKANPEFRKAYYSATEDEQKTILEKRIKDYEQRYFPTRRRPFSKQFDFKRFAAPNQSEAFNTNNTDRLSRLSERNVVNGSWQGRRSNIPESILSDNAPSTMDDSGQYKHNDVRRLRNIERGGRISLATQLIKNYKEDNSKANELELFKDIRENLKPKFLFKELNKFNIQESDYRYFKGKNGYRIKAGSHNLNVSDFLTKNLHLDWKEAKEILLESYQKQSEFSLDNEQGNYIIFKPEVGLRNEYTVWDSINVFNYLKRLEAQEAYDMKGLDKLRDLVNKEEGNEIKPKHKHLSFEEQHQLQQQQREFKLDDVVATKNLKKNEVTYKDSLTGDNLFIDRGDRIKFADKQPSDSAVLAGIKIAAEKYGTVKLSGTEEFKQSVIEQAAKNGIKVVFEPKQLHEQFVELKATIGNEQEIVKVDQMTQQQAQQPLSDGQQEQQSDQAMVNDSEGEIVSFGQAKYLNKKDNKISYNVTLRLSDGSEKVLWGKGLQDVIEENQLKVGDKAEFKHLGVQPVDITVDVLDDNKNKIGEQTKTVNKNVWEAENIERKEPLQQQQREPLQQKNAPQFDNGAKVASEEDKFNTAINSADSMSEANAAMDEYHSQMMNSQPDYDYSQFEQDYGFDEPQPMQQEPVQQVQPQAVVNDSEIQSLVNKAVEAINEARNNPDDFDAELNEADAYSLADKAGQKAFEQDIKENPFTDKDLAEQFDNGYSSAKFSATNTNQVEPQQQQPEQQQPEEATINKGFYRINFKWDATEQAYEPRINGQPLSDKVTLPFVENLRKDDQFLSNFSSEQIMSGKLKADQIKNGKAPKGITVNEYGNSTAHKDEDKKKQSLSL